MSLDRGYISISSGQISEVSCWIKMIGLFKNKQSRNLSLDGGALLIPLGCGDYDWESIKVSSESVVDLLKQKIEKKELIGFSLYHTNFGLEDVLTVTSDIESNTIIFAMPDSCKAIKGTAITDFGYYLEIIAPICLEAFGVISIGCKQYLDR